MFSERLAKLLIDSRYKSVEQFARRAQEKGYIKGDENVINPLTGMVEKASQSIVKQIHNHLASETVPENLKANYIMAYCEMLNCSADYLLMRTNVQNPDIDIRGIVEKTGLTENAVEGLIDSSYLGDMENSAPSPDWRSILLSGWAEDELNQDWEYYIDSIAEYYTSKVVLDALSKRTFQVRMGPKATKQLMTLYQDRPDNKYIEKAGFFAKLQTEIMAKLQNDAETEIRDFIYENKKIFLNNLVESIPQLPSDVNNMMDLMVNFIDGYKIHE